MEILESSESMQLALPLASRFNSTIRERGHQYFRQRRVSVRHGSSSEVGGQVRRSELYHVMLQWTGSQLAVLCDCPFFVDRDQPCKHLWAAILAADAGNYLSDVASSRVLDMDTQTLLKKFAEQDAGLAAIAAAPLHRPIPAFKAPPRPAAWKTQLSSIFTAPASAAWENHWPDNAEILYIVDIARSLATANLVLSLESRESKNNGGWKNAGPLLLRRSMVSSLPVVEDREVLSMLMGGGRNYDYGRYDSCEQLSQTYSVAPVLANAVMPRVVRTGRCFLPHEKDAAELVPLAWDEGEPCSAQPVIYQPQVPPAAARLRSSATTTATGNLSIFGSRLRTLMRHS
jgi:hypothetical protein